MTERELDQLIDGALADYAAEPPVGLEQRMLARVRRPRYWPLAAISAVAAAIVAVVAMPEAPPLPPPPPLIATIPTVPALAPIPKALPVIRPAIKAGIPLSPQERRIEQLMRTHPELADQLVAKDSKAFTEPLGIRPLELTPITIEPLETVAPTVY
jgi:hypothetical protein